MKEKELLKLKEDIEEAKVEVSKLEGRKGALMDQLLEDWDCKTIEEAKKLLKKKKKELEKVQKEAEKLTSELEDKYF